MKVIQVVWKNLFFYFVCFKLILIFLGEPLLVQKRTVTSSNSRPNTSTSATFDQVDQTSDEASTDENASAQNRNERSPVRSNWVTCQLSLL